MDKFDKAIESLQNIVEYWTCRPSEVEVAKLAITALKQQQEREHGCGVSEPLIAELEKCIANMERDINERDKIYIHISNAKALVDQLNRTQPSDDYEKVIRCAKCKHYEYVEGGIDFCSKLEVGVTPNSYCSYGWTDSVRNKLEGEQP